MGILVISDDSILSSPILSAPQTIIDPLQKKLARTCEIIIAKMVIIDQSGLTPQIINPLQQDC